MSTTTTMSSSSRGSSSTHTSSSNRQQEPLFTANFDEFVVEEEEVLDDDDDDEYDCYTIDELSTIWEETSQDLSRAATIDTKRSSSKARSSSRGSSSHNNKSSSSAEAATRSFLESLLESNRTKNNNNINKNEQDHDHQRPSLDSFFSQNNNSINNNHKNNNCKQQQQKQQQQHQDQSLLVLVEGVEDPEKLQALQKAATQYMTLVSYLTGEEVVVPTDDDEYSFVSYKSDMSGASTSIVSEPLTEEESNYRQSMSSTRSLDRSLDDDSLFLQTIQEDGSDHDDYNDNDERPLR